MPESRPLLHDQPPPQSETKPRARPSTFRIAQQAYRQEGLGVFFRGLGVCSARAFIVNAVQWAVRPKLPIYLDLSVELLADCRSQFYEWTMKMLTAA